MANEGNGDGKGKSGGGGAGGASGKKRPGGGGGDHKLVLTLETLPRLDDGLPAVQFNRLMEAAVKDCMDRPGDDKARKVTMQVSMKPDGTNNVCDRVVIEIEFKATVPQYCTRQYHAATHTSGKLLFSPSSPDDPDQMGMFDKDE